MKKKSVCIVGLGYIGLPTAALIANSGFKVSGVDIHQNIVQIINKGGIHIVEPDLDIAIKEAIESENFKAYIDVQKSDIYIICVPTPFHKSLGVPIPNIDYVLDAAKSIAKHLKSGDLIIIESTSPVGTTETVRNYIKDSGVNIDNINIAYCPERVLPGKILKELVENDRIVGGIDIKSTKLASDFYRNFVKGEVFETTAKTAEMCKLVENSSRDVSIAFANELSIICDKEDINVWELIELANKHPRVNILQPGAGVGGHCIAVDPWFIVSRDEDNSRLIRTAREVNDFKTNWVIERIKIAVSDINAKKNIKPIVACLGLAFKPDIDDLRESPALEIVSSLSKQGYDLIVVEPNIKNHELFSMTDIYSAIDQADLLVILVRHKEFLSQEIIPKLKKSNTLDFCGALQ